MNRWWLVRKYGIPPWMLDGRCHPSEAMGLPVVFESDGGPGVGGGAGGSGDGSGGSGEGAGAGGVGDGDDDDPIKLKAKLTKLNADLRTAKATASKVTQLEQQLEQLNSRDQSDLEKANAKITKLEKDIQTAQAAREQALIRSTVERLAREMSFIDEDVAFALMDRSTVAIDEEGKVEGVKEALEALLASKPHLKKKEEENHGTEGSGKAPGPTPRRTGDVTPPKNPVNAYMDRSYGAKPRVLSGRNGSNGG